MTSVFCTSTSTPTDGSIRESSSTTSTEVKKSAPVPPSASGTSMPMSPSSKSRRTMAGSIACARSIAMTLGATSLVANSRTVSWKRTSCSLRLVSAAGAAVRIDMGGSYRGGVSGREAK